MSRNYASVHALDASARQKRASSAVSSPFLTTSWRTMRHSPTPPVLATCNSVDLPDTLVGLVGLVQLTQGRLTDGCDAAFRPRSGDPVGTSIARTCCVEFASRERSCSSRGRQILPPMHIPRPAPATAANATTPGSSSPALAIPSAAQRAHHLAPFLIRLAAGKRQRARERQVGGLVSGFHVLIPGSDVEFELRQSARVS